MPPGDVPLFAAVEDAIRDHAQSPLSMQHEAASLRGPGRA